MTKYFFQLFTNNRFYILLGSFIFSLLVYLWILTTTASQTLQVIKAEQIYGLTSLFLLYLALLAGPFCYTFKHFPWNKQYSHARRALGVGSFYFALLHAALSFFKQLGGFEGLSFLDEKYLFAVILGFVSLCILFVLTITSVDYAVEKMHFKNWKLLHRFVYLAGILILAHTIMLGSHYSDLSGIIAQGTFFALGFLLFLEVPRFEKIFTKTKATPQFGIASLLLVLLFSGIYFWLFAPFSSQQEKNSLSLHAQHQQLAKDAMQNGNNSSQIPGLQGDRNLRYSVSFIKPDSIKPNQNVELRFRITDATNGNRVTIFRTFYEKPMHLLVVDDSLISFAHLHPVQDNDEFVITTSFANPDRYRLYLQFQPWGAIEQQIAFTLPVGQTNVKQTATQPLDTNLTKQFGKYEVTLDTHGELDAEAMSLGEQIISVTLKDAQTKEPIMNLHPYLATFGHMTMINQLDYSFLHIHPANLTPVKPDERGGPTVDFMPIGIYGKFKPGIYRMFVELNPDGKLFTADFTVKIN